MTDVHTEHCCSRHGCKYGDWNGKGQPLAPPFQSPDRICTVTSGAEPQSYPCEDCGYEDMETARTLKRLLSDGRFGFVAETKATIEGVIAQLTKPYPWLDIDNPRW